MLDQQNDGPEQSPTEEKVGYRKPPMRRRFKASGNPNGRPPGSKNRKTIVKAVANEMHSVRENGKWQRRSTLELVLLRLRNKALEGNVRAFEEFHRLTKAYEPQVADGVGGYLVVQPKHNTMEEARAEAAKHNATAKRPRGY